MELAGCETLGEILPIQAARADLAEKAALRFGDESYTYADLDFAAMRAAARLQAIGAGAGDAVAIVLPNVPAMVAFLFGILRIGSVVVPLNPALTPSELLPMLQDSAARALVTTDDLAPRFESLRTNNPWLPRVLPVDANRPLDCAARGGSECCRLGQYQPLGPEMARPLTSAGACRG